MCGLKIQTSVAYKDEQKVFSQVVNEQNCAACMAQTY